MKVLHIINDLRRGGAETALVRLVADMKRKGDSPFVVCLMGEGEQAPALVELGIPVHALGMKGGAIRPADLIRLAKLIRRERPEVVQTWMYHPNLIGGLATKFAGRRTPVAWSIHHSILHPASSKRSTILVSKICAKLSRFLPSRIVYCGISPRTNHEASGYASTRGMIIPNGVSIETFAPNPETRHEIRQEIGVAPDDILIGIAARFHPDKDLPTFVRAAGELARKRPNVHFLMCGTGVEPSNDELMQEVHATGNPDRFHLIGERSDVPRVLTALDIASLSSVTEAVPNAILEAMATGVPFVGTDVGDSAVLMGDTGRAVPPSNPEALASAWEDLLSLPANEFKALGEAARERVKTHYRLEVTSEKYRDLYRELSRSR